MTSLERTRVRAEACDARLKSLALGRARVPGHVTHGAGRLCRLAPLLTLALAPLCGCAGQAQPAASHPARVTRMAPSRPQRVAKPAKPAEPETPWLEVAEGRPFEQRVLKADKPVFAYIYRHWCVRCWLIARGLSKFHEEYAGRVRFVKINGYSNKGLLRKYQIPSAAVVLIFHQGRPIRRIVGLHAGETYRYELNAALREIESASGPARAR